MRACLRTATAVLVVACSSSSRVTAPRPPVESLPPSLGLPGGGTADTLQLGEAVQLSAGPVTGADDTTAAPAVTWWSSDEGVAVVSSTGLVTARGLGNATITAAITVARESVTVLVLGAPRTLPPAPVSVVPPELPRAYVDTDPVPVTGRTITVGAGGDLQGALDAAEPGDRVLLEAGATFRGNFVLPAKSDSGWITVAGSDTASLPPAGRRLTPADAATLPKLITANGRPAVATAPGAQHYRLVGIEVSAAPEVTSTGALVALGTGGEDQTTMAAVPSNLVLDRVYVHGHAALSFSRCVTLNSATTAVVDSYIAECHSRTNDSQAIIGWNGPGPFKIENNYLEGAGENVMFGGGDPSIPDLVPADIEIRRNHFYKPLAWQGGEWVVKNLLELKNARRVLVEGNVFENCWAAAQGSALVWKSVNQHGGAPWSTTSDVTFQYNIVRRVNAALNLAGHPEQHPADRAARFRLAHNVFELVGDSTLLRDGRAGRLWQVNRVLDVEIAHNTGLGTTNGLFLIGVATPGGFVLRDNVFGGGPGVASADSQGVGAAALSYHVPGWAMAGNVVIGAPADSVSYPDNNLYAPTADAAGLSGDLRVVAAPALGSASTDGATPGADWATVERKTAGVAAPSASVGPGARGGLTRGTTTRSGSARRCCSPHRRPPGGGRRPPPGR